MRAAEADLSVIDDEMAPSACRPDTDPTEIKAQIEALRSFTGSDAFGHRLRLASRLRKMVTSLTVAPEGKGPQIAKTKAMLLANEPDKQYRDAVLAAIEEGYRDTHAYYPTFQVNFADGTMRRVAVNKEDATAMVVETVIGADGDAVVRQEGRRDWHLNRPLSDAEIELVGEG